MHLKQYCAYLLSYCTPASTSKHLFFLDKIQNKKVLTLDLTSKIIKMSNEIEKYKLELQSLKVY